MQVAATEPSTAAIPPALPAAPVFARVAYVVEGALPGLDTEAIAQFAITEFYDEVELVPGVSQAIKAFARTGQPQRSGQSYRCTPEYTSDGTTYALADDTTFTVFAIVEIEVNRRFNPQDEASLLATAAIRAA